jgi:CTP:molybdopterin cytidylyltransferase MocA
MLVPYDSYQLLEAERRKTTAELRASDVRRGEFAAGMSRSLRAGGAQIRGLAVVLADAFPGFHKI